MNEIKISSKLLADVTELVYKNTLKINLFKKNPPNKNGMKSMLKGYINGAIRCGVFDYQYKEDRLEAFIIFTKANFAPGVTVTMGTLNCTGTKSSLDWVKEKLTEYAILFNSRSHFELPIHLKKMLPYMENLGFSIDTLKLIGRPDECQKKFSRNFGSNKKFEDYGLQLCIPTKKDLMVVKEIERKEFKRNPQYGWFVSDEAWLKNSFNERVDSLKDKKCSAYVLKDKRNKVKGFFGVNLRKTPNFGLLGGPEFVFDKSIQGKGLSKIGYRILLDDMVKGKADFFMGNTSQIGVLKNAKSMGRAPINLCLRFTKGHFKTQYFLENI